VVKVSVTDYKEHKLKHEGKKTFTCSKCGKCFHIKENMKRRFLQCGNKQRSFSCDICGKKLRCERYLKEHLKGHSNPDQYQCATCGNCL
jgi:uncharacterized Zn-finger protein